MDQWRSTFSESFGLDRHWSIECSSLSCLVATLKNFAACPLCFGVSGGGGAECTKCLEFSAIANAIFSDAGAEPVIEFFRGRPRGGDNFTSVCQVLAGAFIQSAKISGAQSTVARVRLQAVLLS